MTETFEERILRRVKNLLGIDDHIQDVTLQEIIETRAAHLRAELESEEIPKVLEFIVVELSVRRFNRLGSEGMKGESVEGHTVNFYELDDEFKPYTRLIDRYRPKEQEPERARGQVFFL
ncbi:phage head-tail connector protein [Bhargavaea ginsengi]|uniref:phage head-tail connector protein n=1 Tax=Bhargavaea ginsengi TaxID=426757 RepID=UPI003C764549